MPPSIRSSAGEAVQVRILADGGHDHVGLERELPSLYGDQPQRSVRGAGVDGHLLAGAAQRSALVDRLRSPDDRPVVEHDPLFQGLLEFVGHGRHLLPLTPVDHAHLLCAQPDGRAGGIHGRTPAPDHHHPFADVARHALRAAAQILEPVDHPGGTGALLQIGESPGALRARRQEDRVVVLLQPVERGRRRSPAHPAAPPHRDRGSAGSLPPRLPEPSDTRGCRTAAVRPARTVTRRPSPHSPDDAGGRHTRARPGPRPPRPPAGSAPGRAAGSAHPCSRAASPRNCSNPLMPTEASRTARLQCPSQGWWQTRPVTAGKGFVSSQVAPGRLQIAALDALDPAGDVVVDGTVDVAGRRPPLVDRRDRPPRARAEGVGAGGRPDRGDLVLPRVQALSPLP